jgi:hypothetical protein
MAVCTNCGNTIYFNAAVVGIATDSNDAGKKDAE